MIPTFSSIRNHTQRPRRILLAEDDDEFRGFLADVLRDDGHEVVEVGDGRLLLQRIAVAVTDGDNLEGIDLVLSDVRMPHADAFEVVSGIRRAKIDVPVLLMTAFGDQNTHEQARQLGVLCVFDKPFDVDDLRTIVCNVPLAYIDATSTNQ